MNASFEQIKIIFFDIDDTLYLKQRDYLPPSIAPAIRQLKARGIIPAIATGRTPCSFPKALVQLIEQEKIDTLVTMNGQYVSYQQQVIEKHPIAQSALQRLTRYFQQQQIDYAFINEQEIVVSNITPMLAEALDPITRHYRLNQDPDYLFQHDIFQLLAFYPASADKMVEDAKLLQQLKTVRWHENSVDIFDINGSKARGIKAVLDHLGLTMEQTMAFGDGLNDIEMLQQVGIGVAMGNAHPQLKSLADYVTDSVAEDGIARFLQQAGLISSLD